MRTLPILLLALAAAPLRAQEAVTLAVNAAPTAETWGEAVATLETPVATAAGETAVLDAVMTFSRSTEALGAPDAEDALTLAVDADGTVKVSDGTAWRATGATVPEDGEHPLAVRIVATSDGARLTFKVKVGDAEELSVAPTSATSGLGTLLFDGEGTVTGVAVAAVPVGILPPATEGGAQAAEKVEAYAAWSRDAAKGGAMAADASDAEKADAFAMNVGGTPSIAITAIEPLADGAVRITVKGAYARGETAGDAPLGAIHGTLYVTHAAALDGAAATEALPVTVEDDGTAAITVPADRGARFLRARVALAPPADTL